MRARKLFALVTLGILIAAPPAGAQTLTFGLFGRYLDALRQQAGIPGMSAAVLSNQQVIWATGFGYRDVTRGLPATPDTPYLIGDLTQTVGAVMALSCVDDAIVALNNPISQWTTEIPEPAARVRDILSHANAAGGFQYDPARFAALTPVVSACRSNRAYADLVRVGILDRFAMANSVPGQDVASSAAVRALFDPSTLARYDSALNNLATPYRVDAAGQATVSSFPTPGLNAATGLISTVNDLARFDAALDDNAILSPGTEQLAWSNAVSASGATLPTGLGWFVQQYNGRRLVWHFGLVTNAFSSLIIKVPDANLTFIVLANSDGLSAPFPLSNGDVTVSLFAQLFLRTFVP
jgi:CubicO group peptidase (beta-lactamase class C family)